MPKSHIQLDKVSDLIDYLEMLGRDRDLIMDIGGNIFPVSEDYIRLWNENDPESPVAVFIAEPYEQFND